MCCRCYSTVHTARERHQIPDKTPRLQQDAAAVVLAAGDVVPTLGCSLSRLVNHPVHAPRACLAPYRLPAPLAVTRSMLDV